MSETRIRPATICTYGNAAVITALSVYFFVAPVVILLFDFADPALHGPGIPQCARRWHRALSPKYARWARERMRSGRAESLGANDVSGTEWPLFGSVFYLQATEALQKDWEAHPAGAAPKVYARETIDAAADLVTDPGQAGWVKKYYGAYPKSPQAIPSIYTEEPAQSGPRRVVVKRPGELGTVIIAHKVPNGRDADQPALEMLDAILSSGKNARLYRALVDRGLALSAGAGTDLHRDLSLHTVYAALAPGSTQEQVEEALLAEIEKIKTDGVTPAEIARVKQQYVAADAYKRDGTAAVASELNEWIAVGDWTLYVTFPEKVQQVTPADVQRVAKQYLNDDESTTGWFVPVRPAAEKGS